MNQPRNLAASVRQRLLNLAIAQKEDFNLVLIRYGIERLLHRLEQSAAGERFILKGAMLFVLWSDTPHRATKDVDLLCRGDNSIAEIEAVFRAVCQADVVPDGLEFDLATVKGELIKADRDPSLDTYGKKTYYRRKKVSLNAGSRPMSRPESATTHQAEKTSKSERLEARLSREQKELLQWAADLEGRSLTDFVVSHAQNAAVQTISEHTVIKLNRADSIAFAESLQSPPELREDAPLARAIAGYKQSQGLG